MENEEKKDELIFHSKLKIKSNQDEVAWTDSSKIDIAEMEEEVVKLCEIIRFSEKNPWHNCDFALKCYEYLQKGYPLSEYQIKRIENAHEMIAVILRRTTCSTKSRFQIVEDTNEP